MSPSPETPSPARPPGIPLFEVAGIRVALDASWFLIFFLVLWSLSAGYFPHVNPGQTAGGYWTAGLLASVLFFASILVHEMSHALMAVRSGIGVTGITLFLFGGVSQMEEEPDDPKTALQVAAVGPLSSFALAGLFAGAAALGGEGWLATVLGYLAWVNLALGVFNLLPGMPLDGGRMLQALVWWRTGSSRRGSRIASDAGKGLAVGIMVLGGLQILAGGLLGGVWLILIGMFIRGTARAGYQQTLVQNAIEGLRVRSVMIPHPETVPPDLPLQRLVDEHVLPQGYRAFPVVEGGTVRGLVTLEQLRDVPAEKREATRVADRMLPLSDALRVGPDETLVDALRRMRGAETRRLLVMEGDRLVGLLTDTSVARVVEIRTLLADADA